MLNGAQRKLRLRRRMIDGRLVLAGRMILPGLLLLSLFATAAEAQVRRTQIARRENIDEFNRFIGDQERDSMEYRRIGGVGQPTQPTVDLSKVDVRQLRTMMQDAATDASQLANSLNADAQAIPALRPYLREAIVIRARGDILAQELRVATNLEDSLPRLQDLSTRWQTLAFHLQQVRGLSRTSIGLIDRINAREAAMAKLFKFDTQLNLPELQSQMAVMETALQNLVDDIQIEFGRSSEARVLVLEGNRVYGQAQYVSSVIADAAPRDAIVKEYNTFRDLWTAMANRLHPLDSRYIDRSVRRISAVDKTMHELLLVAHEANTQELLNSTASLMRNVDEFFARTPLKLILQLSRPESSLTLANEFYGVCENFEDCVTRKEKQTVLLDCFSYVEETGHDFLAAYKPLKSQSGQIVLREIEDAIYGLREAMHFNDSFNSRGAIDLVASMDSLAIHLDDDLKLLMSRSRSTGNIEALRLSAAFAAKTQELHASLYNDASLQTIRPKVSDLYNVWTRLYYDHLQKIQGADREHIRRLSSEITSNLVDLMSQLNL